jgi:hypothetical protein
MKNLDDIFGLGERVVTKTVTEVKEVPVIYDADSNLVPIKKEIDFHLEAAINALLFNIDEGTKLYKCAKDVASSSDSHKLYEVCSTILGETRANALALMEIHKKFNEAECLSDGPASKINNTQQITANNVNVIKASSSDILKMMTEMQNRKMLEVDSE